MKYAATSHKNLLDHLKRLRVESSEVTKKIMDAEKANVDAEKIQLAAELVRIKFEIEELSKKISSHDKTSGPGPNSNSFAMKRNEQYRKK